MYDFTKPQYANTQVTELTWQMFVDWGKHGIFPESSFVLAVLQNNFKEACCQADEVNRRFLYEIALFVINELPALCQGSPDNFSRWITKKRRQRDDAPYQGHGV